MKTLSIATESIAFQSKSFFRNVCALVKNYRESARTSDDELKLARNLGMSIGEHTNILMDVRFVEENTENALCAFPILNANAVIGNQHVAKIDPKILGQLNKRVFGEVMTGFVDPVTSRVGGAFAKIPHRMLMTRKMLNSKKYDDEMIAGFVIHETGHAFTVLQFVAESTIANVVLADTARKYMEEPDYKKAVLILRNTADVVSDNELTWVDQINPEQDRAAGAEIFLAHTAAARNSLDSNVHYSYDNCEQLADIFAVRHGAAQALMRARALTDNTEEILANNQVRGAMIGNFVAVFSSLALTGLMLTTSPMISVIAALTAIVNISIFRRLGGKVFMQKDIATNHETIQKIRNQAVEALKSSSVPASERKDYMKALELGEALLKEQTKEMPQVRFELLSNIVNYDRSQRRKSREYTDRLENLVSNELFVKAARMAG